MSKSSSRLAGAAASTRKRWIPDQSKISTRGGTGKLMPRTRKERAKAEAVGDRTAPAKTETGA